MTEERGRQLRQLGGEGCHLGTVEVTLVAEITSMIGCTAEHTE